MDNTNNSTQYDRIVIDVFVYDQLLEEQKAVMLIYLALQYYRCVNGADGEGWFRVSYGDIKERLGTSSDTITHAIRRLHDIQFIDVKRVGKNINYYHITERVLEQMKYIILRPLVIEKLFRVPKSALRLYLSLHIFRMEQQKKGQDPILVTRDDIRTFVGIANNTISTSRDALHEQGLIEYERSKDGKAPMFYVILEE
ncbi:hypothetical protein ABHN11_13355 [Brevibacillus centrosporus]|jgi:DNA-binding MarR family transcriptional regulator|uniref:hypothetical protein n=1 Tax=Brevibacillus centrosporus TaxID=54910 RepID=UPI0039880B00